MSTVSSTFDKLLINSWRLYTTKVYCPLLRLSGYQLLVVVVIPTLQSGIFVFNS